MIDRALDLPEWIENVREHLRIDADPAIPDLQHNIAALYLRRQPNTAAWLRVLGGIVQEVRQHLIQPAGVRIQGHRLRRQCNVNLLAARFEGCADRLDRSRNGLRQIQPLLEQPDLAVFNTRDVQQAVDQTADALRLPFHQAPDGLPLDGIVPLKRKYLTSVADRCQRGAQLMPQLGEELVHVTVGRAEFSIGTGVAGRFLTSLTSAQNWTGH
jgi:hypothetical protein